MILLFNWPKNPRQRARYCTHSLVDDEVHEMVIYHKEGTYIRPHKHIGKTESFHLIDGEADVVFFDDELINCGARKDQIQHFMEETESLDAALDWAQPGDLIIMLALSDREAIQDKLKSLSSPR